MHPAHAEYFLDLRRRLEAAPHKERGDIIAAAAACMGWSTQTIYKRLHAGGYESGRKQRADRGKSSVDKELAVLAAGLLQKSTRANGKRTLPLTTVTEILEENGMGIVNQETGEVTMPHPATVSRAMRLYNCHPAQLAAGSPHTELRTLHPNHVWQMDASTCVIFYMPKGEVAVMDERLYNERKPQNLAKLDKQRVIRWVLTDHYSGSLFARYTLGSEDAAGAISILIEAMCRRSEQDPFCGVPLILNTDPGPAYMSGLMQTFLQRIGVRYIDHAAGNARATGSAEVHQNIVERLFEGRLRVYAPRGLADLNARLDAWRCMFNAERQHSRHGKSRNALWLTITQDQLRLPASAEVLRELVSGPPRSVKVKGSLIIEYTPKGYERQSYSLRHIPGVHPGACVGVSVNAYDAPAVDVTVSSPDKPDVTYTLQPIARDRAGFAVDAPVIGEEYKAPKDTAADKALKAIERAAYAAPTLEAAKAAAKSGARPYADINIMADVEAARPHNYMQRSGRALVADARPTVRDLPPVSHYEAFVRLRPALERAGIEWTPEHMTHLKQRYPDGVPVEAIPALEAAFLARPSDNAAAGSTLRLAAGGAS